MEFIQQNLALMAVGVAAVAAGAYAVLGNKGAAVAEEVSTKKDKNNNKKGGKKDVKKNNKKNNKKEESSDSEEEKAPAPKKESAEDKAAAAAAAKLQEMEAKMAEMQKLLAAKSAPAPAAPTKKEKKAAEQQQQQQQQQQAAKQQDTKKSAPAATPAPATVSAAAPASAKKNAQPQQAAAAPQQQQGKQDEKKKDQKQPQQQQQQQNSKQQQSAAAAPVAQVKVTQAIVEDGWEIVPEKTKSSKPTNDEEKKGSKGAASYIEIPAEHNGKIIGPKGETLKKLQEVLNVQIDIPKGAAHNSITIEGSLENRQRAITAIKELAAKGYCRALNGDMQEVSISVNAKKLGNIIGAKGVFLRALEEKTGCKVTMPPREESKKEEISTKLAKNAAQNNHKREEEKATFARVKVLGEADKVKEVAAAINCLVKYQYSEITHEGWSRLDVDFPFAYKKTLLGPKGQTIKSIQGNTGCFIETDDLKDTGKLTISGPGTKLAQAKKEVMNVKNACEAGNEKASECADGFDEDVEDSRANLW